jgi:hypothetical protein
MPARAKFHPIVLLAAAMLASTFAGMASASPRIYPTGVTIYDPARRCQSARGVPSEPGAVRARMTAESPFRCVKPRAIDFVDTPDRNETGAALSWLAPYGMAARR